MMHQFVVFVIDDEFSFEFFFLEGFCICDFDILLKDFWVVFLLVQ